MSNYTKTTNFATKDSLPSGNPAKIVKGTEIDIEFNNIAVAVATKPDTGSISGGTGIDTTPSGNSVSIAIDSTVATLTGTQTLTNKTLNTPAITGALTTNSTIDGRDVATDGTKLDGIEASADVTDTANVTAAGALMDSEVTNLAEVKAFDSTDYATAAQGTKADAALPTTGGAMTGDLSFGDNNKAQFGADDDLEIYHDGSHSYVVDGGTGNLFIGGTSYVDIGNGVSGLGGQTYARFNTSGSCQLKHNGVDKIETTASGVDVNGSVSLTSGASDWSFTVSGNDLVISYGGSNKAKLDTSGNLTVVGNVTAYGTI